jgi:hypothetical protein
MIDHEFQKIELNSEQYGQITAEVNKLKLDIELKDEVLQSKKKILIRDVDYSQTDGLDEYYIKEKDEVLRPFYRNLKKLIDQRNSEIKRMSFKIVELEKENDQLMEDSEPSILAKELDKTWLGRRAVKHAMKKIRKRIGK